MNLISVNDGITQFVISLLVGLAHTSDGDSTRCGMVSLHMCLGGKAGAPGARTTFAREFGTFVQNRQDHCFSDTIKAAVKNDNCYYSKKDGIAGPLGQNSDCPLCPTVADFIETEFIRGTGVKWPCYNSVLSDLLFDENKECLGVDFKRLDIYKLAAIERTHLAHPDERHRSGLAHLSATGRLDFCGHRDTTRAAASADCFRDVSGGRAHMPSYCAAVDQCAADSPSDCDSRAAMSRMCTCMGESRRSRFAGFKKGIDQALDAVRAGKLSEAKCQTELEKAFVSNGASYWEASQRVMVKCLKDNPFVDGDALMVAACEGAAEGGTGVQKMLHIFVNLMEFLVERFTKYCSCL